MRTSTQESYRRRLTNVVEYIHDHLDSELDVNTLAGVASMSPYHFHRVYRQLAKETVNATVRRLRMQNAALELIRSDRSVTQIAEGLAYGSIEAFSRAFSRQFGVSPAAYREDQRAAEQVEEAVVPSLPERSGTYQQKYEVEIVDFAQLQLVGFPHTGDYLDINRVFEKLYIYAGSNGLIDDTMRSIGLYYDDPGSVAREQLRSMACISVPQAVELSDDQGPQSVTIPTGRCAALLFEGSYAELEKPYDWFFGQWIPQSGHELADFPPFEEYLNDPKQTRPAELLTRVHCLLAS